MTSKRYRRRGVAAPAEIQRRIGEMLKTLGPQRAAAKLRVRREQLISVAAGVPVLAGTVALIEQRLAESEAA